MDLFGPLLLVVVLQPAFRRLISHLLSGAKDLPRCAEHVSQLGGESPLPNLMEVKG
jgi:hypothetical protein